jgi:D-glutamate cyclase
MVGGLTNENGLAAIADIIETQCCIEIRSSGAFAGVVRTLQLAARELHGGSPYLVAARTLAKVVRPGDIVLLATGFPVAEVMPRGETDGPPGAAALARALALGLGAHPLLLGELATLEPIRAACQTIGLEEACPGAWPEDRPAFVLDSFPDDEMAAEHAEELLSWLRPKALLVTEKPGPNVKGIAHRAGGLPVGPGRARIEVLLERAHRAGVPTIGVGDNGNEAGLGAIAEATRRCQPYGSDCRCPCGAGIAAAAPADITVVGSVSNWACYGIAACLALLLGKPELVHDGPTEENVIDACVAAGAVDGFGARGSLVDGIPAVLNGYVVELLAAIVRAALAPS